MLTVLLSLGCVIPSAPVPPATPPPDMGERASSSASAPAPPTRPPDDREPPAGPGVGAQHGVPPPALAGRPLAGRPPDPVATDLSNWRGSPPQMVASASAASAERVAFATKVGAVLDVNVFPSTYTLTWIPPGGAKGVLVTLHGHGAWAFDELYLWYTYAQERQLAIVAVQWWDTLFESELDYLAPKPLWDVISATVTKRFGVDHPPVILHGFSRGSAQVYGVAAWDRVATVPLFSGVIANAGGVEDDYPVTLRLDRGDFGQAPFQGMPWVVVCSDRDYQPEISGCPAMRRTQGWLEKLGATVTLIEDPAGGHGSFQKNTADVDQVLDLLFPATR